MILRSQLIFFLPNIPILFHVSYVKKTTSIGLTFLWVSSLSSTHALVIEKYWLLLDFLQRSRLAIKTIRPHSLNHIMIIYLLVNIKTTNHKFKTRRKRKDTNIVVNYNDNRKKKTRKRNASSVKYRSNTLKTKFYNQ